MNPGWKRTILGGMVWLLSVVAWAGGQAGPEPKPPMAEEVFKNVQLLKGIPVDEFMGTMGFFSASLGLNCTDCHVDESGGNWEKYADDNALKQGVFSPGAHIPVLSSRELAVRKPDIVGT